jgi:hypothetical protein
MKPYTFKVTPLPRIHSHDSALSADELNQLIDLAEPLSDLNYTRFSQLDCLRQGILSTELRHFVTPDMRGLSVQGIEIMVAHGRMAYESTKDLISYLESKN